MGPELYQKQTSKTHMQQIPTNSRLIQDDTPLWETLVFETTTDRRPSISKQSLKYRKGQNEDNHLRHS